jgi:biopolymer transport protein ExbD
MSIRKKNKHVGEVNMSSMTDIIFMLLIFFMLTSTLVRYFPVTLPKSESRTNSKIKTSVMIGKAKEVDSFFYMVNTDTVPFDNMEQYLNIAFKDSIPGEQKVLTIAAEQGVPFGEITKVMIVANRMKAKTILATDTRD